MKRWMAGVCCAVFLGGAMYAGYKTLEQVLIQKELQADLQAEQDYLSSLAAARLSAPTKQALVDLSEQNKTQLTQAAQASHTLTEFHQKKEQLLKQWAQEDTLGAILAQEPKRPL